MTINDYFPKVFVINLERRKDRRALCQAELLKSGLNMSNVQYFPGIDRPLDAHDGCSSSHYAVISEIAEGPWDRVLVLEDDWKVIEREILVEAGFAAYKPSPVLEAFDSVLDGGGNFSERFEALIPYLPEKWDVLYLGAGYGEPPISRFNKHVIRCGFMQTTSTYGITKRFAKKWVALADEHRNGGAFGPIDNLFGSFSHDHLYYVLQPRIAYQRGSKSDITGLEISYLLSMTDPAAEQSV